MNWFKHHRKFVLIGFGSGVLALILLTYVGLTFGTSAKVTLDLRTKPLSKDVSITIDSQRDSSDPEQLILAAQTVEKEVSGEKSRPTSGVKLVGEKAKGKITVFNKTNDVKTFEAGTTVSTGTTSFTLDETVQVASASVKKSTNSESKEYGQADVAVTATKIGADYNLAEKTELKVATYGTDTYSAVVAIAFTGGSSREIRVVSDEDRRVLLADLKKDLIEQAGKELSDEAPDGEAVVPTQSAEIIDSEYSAEIGDEVAALTLNLTINAKALSYAIADLKPLASQVLQADVPPGYKLAEDDAQLLTSPDETASGSGKAKLSANISSKAVPDLNQDQLKAEMANKLIEEVQQTFSTRDTIEGIKIELFPAIAAQLRPRMPKDPDKIELELTQ